MHGFGDLEAVLMQRIWDHGGTLTVRDLFDELREERNIAYTTVMSTMDNLYRKGWLARERDGKAYRYAAGRHPRGVQRPADARGHGRGR